MAMFKENPQRPSEYQRFERETPEWFRDAKLGIFVHWGAYSVPAWAEPIGALGTFEPEYWFSHNPYAEWYYNTIRVDGSPAQEHQRDVHGGAPYDEFLDQWKAEKFDADELMALVKSTGARYVVPTTKHHDGIALWDAPGTGDRNTVRRGPERDLIAEFRDAAERQGIRFGVYYSGGLDWHFNDSPAVLGDPEKGEGRPVGRAYADYAFDHVADLIERYRPEVLWGDIEWPDAGKPDGEKSMAELFRRFYASRPEGVVNDRWGETHWDFRTSEYERTGGETEGMWENCRGIGFSFGYNQLDDETNSLDARGAIRHFLDVVSRGGNLLLNIGPMASGEIPELQRQTLAGLAAFNQDHGDAIFGSRALDASIARPSDGPWVRWTRTEGVAHAFIDAEPGSRVVLDIDRSRFDAARAEPAPGASVEHANGDVVVNIGGEGRPVRVDMPLR